MFQMFDGLSNYFIQTSEIDFEAILSGMVIFCWGNILKKYRKENVFWNLVDKSILKYIKSLIKNENYL